MCERQVNKNPSHLRVLKKKPPRRPELIPRSARGSPGRRSPARKMEDAACGEAPRSSCVTRTAGVFVPLPQSSDQHRRAPGKTRRSRRGWLGLHRGLSRSSPGPASPARPRPSREPGSSGDLGRGLAAGSQLPIATKPAAAEGRVSVGMPARPAPGSPAVPVPHPAPVLGAGGRTRARDHAGCATRRETAPAKRKGTYHKNSVHTDITVCYAWKINVYPWVSDA